MRHWLKEIVALFLFVLNNSFKFIFCALVEGFRSLGTTGSCEVPCVCWEMNPGSSGRAASTPNHCAFSLVPVCLFLWDKASLLYPISVPWNSLCSQLASNSWQVSLHHMCTEIKCMSYHDQFYIEYLGVEVCLSIAGYFSTNL